MDESVWNPPNVSTTNADPPFLSESIHSLTVTDFLLMSILNRSRSPVHYMTYGLPLKQVPRACHDLWVTSGGPAFIFLMCIGVLPWVLSPLVLEL